MRQGADGQSNRVATSSPMRTTPARNLLQFTVEDVPVTMSDETIAVPHTDPESLEEPSARRERATNALPPGDASWPESIALSSRSMTAPCTYA